MMDMLKKSVLAGLGTAVVTKSKVKETMDKLVEQGRLSSDEAERFTQEMVDAGEKEMEELRSEMESSVRNAVSRLNLASQEDMDDLRQRLENVERRMEHLEQKLES
jgi:polyhydroxyalkanoate synthesis regulator phasin